LQRARVADRETNLFDGTEFISSGVLFKTTNAEVPKKQRFFRQVPHQRVSGGLDLHFDRKIIFKKWYTPKVLFLCNPLYPAQAIQ